MSVNTCKQLMGAAACVLALGACGSMEKKQVAPPPTLAQLMSGASSAAGSGQNEQASSLWKRAAAAYPADKYPWVRLAQMRYDAGQYGEAIVNAQEVLVRDPNDSKAYSIIAISGLRLATRALADLSRQNNLQGSLRTESQELAKLLRESLGESVLIPAHDSGPTPKSVKVKKPLPAPPPSRNDPFEGLK
ncbi:hypothetical protein [Massilia glaciei]|uniref:hypothetical protein n=1 Tax=Massilia glaciei TaxID=1524097 RepID=UPI0015E8085D|nr:hypothetical protein [Massilia glaciei]